MRIGVVFPQTEFPGDPSAIRDYAQTAEELGFSHILAYDHVLGANPNRAGGWNGPYTYRHSFQEPLVLFSFIAALTHKLEFTTGVIILPQRQAALFAKQTATLDLLSGGRLRLGIGLGWNEVEYVAQNENFTNRGRRIEEQVHVLRQLWTQPLVDFHGRWHNIPDAGINPLPQQRPIPIWFGGNAEPALRRAAALGDGWMPGFHTASEARSALDLIEQCLAEAGRSRDSFGIEPRLSYGQGNPDSLIEIIDGWQAAGTTHLSLNTMGSGFDTPEKHIRAIQTFAQAVGLVET
ncbi:MAG: LLM class F420-dependent oxidoreductase [Chloroflexota bacterium]